MFLSSSKITGFADTSDKDLVSAGRQIIHRGYCIRKQDRPGKTDISRRTSDLWLLLRLSPNLSHLHHQGDTTTSRLYAKVEIHHPRGSLHLATDYVYDWSIGTTYVHFVRPLLHLLLNKEAASTGHVHAWVKA